MDNTYDVTEPRFAPELIAERLDNVRGELTSLLHDYGGQVKLLAVTKTVPVDVINYTIDELGIDAIGENRVQELLEKYDQLHKPASGKLEIHIIGSLQTNKVKYIIDKVDMIESVDSLKLAAEIDKQAKKVGRTMDILVEVNIGREPQKGGIMPDELRDLVSSISVCDSLVLRGIMTIAPVSSSEEYAKYFAETKLIYDDLKNDPPSGIDPMKIDTLSMGMSGSWREAVIAGSNEIRLGSSIFGARNYSVSTLQ
ncbi:MAG: YggS family pyridoxal phosphate-dependent enzyme [Clostridiales bacterium]|nr:YggS family pyridoxal phosphate-dependent enzyme [Clostridiales bacterium]